MTALPAELAELSIAEKRELVALLNESIAEEEGQEDEIDEEYNQELRRRLEEAKQHPERLIPEEQAKAIVEGRLAELRAKRKASA